MTDKQLLREVSKKAKHAGEAPVMPFNQRISALKDFQRQATPDTVLALLDELEAKDAELQEYRKADGREKIRAAHAEWSRETFGSVGPVGPLKHLAKEALEAAAAPGDLSEWADMQFLLWDAQIRAGITDEQITQAMFEKFGVNKSRQWPEPKDGEPRFHVKSGPQL